MKKISKLITKVLNVFIVLAIIGCGGILIYSQLAPKDAEYEFLEDIFAKDEEAAAQTSSEKTTEEAADEALSANDSTDTPHFLENPETEFKTSADETTTTTASSTNSEQSTSPSTTTIVPDSYNAKTLASLATGIPSLLLTKHDDLTIQGKQYFAFTYQDSYGSEMNQMIVIDKTDGTTYYYDTLGNLRVAWQIGIVEDGNTLAANTALAENTADLSVSDTGVCFIKGISKGSTYDTVLRQICLNNGILETPPGYLDSTYTTTQSCEEGEGEDILGIASQTLFGYSCTMCYNFDKDISGYIIHDTAPKLEGINCYFKTNQAAYDSARAVRDKISTILGEPMGITQSEMFISYAWYTASNTVVLNYVYSNDVNDYVLRSLNYR